MAKPRRKTILKWIRQYPFLKYIEETSTIYCSACDIHLKTQRKNVVTHISSKTHEFKSSGDNNFYLDLIIFLVSCNIPWNRINDPQFRTFFEKYICCSCSSKKLPDETLLRRIHLDIVYNQTVQKIREKMIGKYLWISIDETVSQGKCVANVIVRELTKNACSKFYLIGRKSLDEVDGNSMAELIKNQLQFLWKNSYDKHINNVLLLSTNSTSYMLKAGRVLKGTFPNLLHVTCFVHGLHRILEHIRSQYKNVDLFINNVKKIFLESHIVRIFKQICPSTPLPPKSVVAKGGIWLNEVLYYAEYFDHIIEVISQLKTNDSAAIEDSKKLLECLNLRSDLVFIKENYGVLCEAIIKLQTSCLHLVESFEILDHVRTIIDWSGSNTIKLKLEEILDEIPDYDIIRDYADLIQKNEYRDKIIDFYKYAPVASLNIECSISSYTQKWTSLEKRINMKGDNLEKIMVIYYYYREDEEDVISTDIDFMKHILNEG